MTLEHFREFYVNYDLDWVDAFVEDLYSDKTDTQILEQYDIEVIPITPREFDVRLVLNCSYDLITKKYALELNGVLLSNDKDADRLKPRLISEIKSAIVHEDTHRQQDQTEPKHLIPNKDDRVEYLSHHTEVAAREVAHQLKSKGLSIQAAMKAVSDLDASLLGNYQKIVWEYRDLDANRKFLNEIWRSYGGED